MSAFNCDCKWCMAEATHNKNKLTTENAESEERSIYKSATDGPIPLSFKGRHLMQKLRTATMAAIQFGNWHMFGEALSRSRAQIAKRMGELEDRVARADSFGAWASSIRTQNLIKRCSNAERRRDELAFDNQLQANAIKILQRDLEQADEKAKINEDFIALQAQRLNAQCDAAKRIRINLDAFQTSLNP